MRSPLSSLLLPLATGILLSLLYYRLAPAALVFVALVPLFVFLDRTPSAIRRAAGGFLAGGIYFLAVLHTLAFVDWFGFISSEHLFMQVAYVTASAYAGLLYAAFAWGYRWINPRSLLMLAYVPALFVLAEAGKRVGAFGFTWGFLGYLAEDLPWMLSGSSIAGVLGLTALIIFANTGITLMAFAARARDMRRCAVIALTIAAVFGIFLASSAAARGFLNEESVVRAAVMETGDRRASLELAIPPYTTLVEEAKAADADVILMPESMIDPRDSDLTIDDAQELVSGLAGDYGGTLIVGGVRREGDAAYNAAFLWHDGKVESVHDKHFLVPFAEYAPAFYARFAPRSIGFYEPGDSYQAPVAGGIRFGVMTCQEANYPEAGTRPVSRGAQILVSGANDGFAGLSPLLTRYVPSEDPWLERIQFGFARFRAAENGRYLLRSTKTGIAGIIRPDGTVLAQSPSDSLGIRVADVALMRGMTPYARTGDWPFLLLCMIVVLGLVIARTVGTAGQKR